MGALSGGRVRRGSSTVVLHKDCTGGVDEGREALSVSVQRRINCRLEDYVGGRVAIKVGLFGNSGTGRYSRAEIDNL